MRPRRNWWVTAMTRNADGAFVGPHFRLRSVAAVARFLRDAIRTGSKGYDLTASRYTGDKLRDHVEIRRCPACGGWADLTADKVRQMIWRGRRSGCTMRRRRGRPDAVRLAKRRFRLYDAVEAVHDA